MAYNPPKLQWLGNLVFMLTFFTGVCWALGYAYQSSWLQELGLSQGLFSQPFEVYVHDGFIFGIGTKWFWLFCLLVVLFPYFFSSLNCWFDPHNSALEPRLPKRIHKKLYLWLLRWSEKNPLKSDRFRDRLNKVDLYLTGPSLLIGFLLLMMFFLTGSLCLINTYLMVGKNSNKAAHIFLNEIANNELVNMALVHVSINHQEHKLVLITCTPQVCAGIEPITTLVHVFPAKSFSVHLPKIMGPTKNSP